MTSKRSKSELSSFLPDYFVKYNNNPFDSETNKNGNVNLGTSENYLCKDLMKERFTRPDMSSWSEDMQFYNIDCGIPSLREALAEFLTEQLKANEPLKAENIFTGSGAGTIFEHLAFSLADEGEYFLCPTPAYAHFWVDFGLRASVKLYNIPRKGRETPRGTKPFQLTAELVATYYNKAIQEGCTVRGILICNPSNPIGSVLDRKDLEDILELCARLKLHVIVDEAYAMSIFDEECKFCSALSLPHIPDPDRLHVVWTFSKDLGLSGMRCGLVHSWNKDLHSILYKKYSYYTSVSIMTQHRLATLIRDRDWMNNVYFPTNLKRMRRAHKLMKESLEGAGVKVYPSRGGFFIWADFSAVLHPLTFEAEKAFFMRLIDFREGGVFIVPGMELYCDEPGWYRIVFTLSDDHIKSAVGRIKKLLNEMRLEDVMSNLAQALTPPKVESSANGTTQVSLEDLLSQMKLSIKSTNWLTENTADKWEQDNPGLAKAFKDAKETS